jgi:hypothetical protein
MPFTAAEEAEEECKCKCSAKLCDLFGDRCKGIGGHACMHAYMVYIALVGKLRSDG